MFSVMFMLLQRHITTFFHNLTVPKRRDLERKVVLFPNRKERRFHQIALVESKLYPFLQHPLQPHSVTE